MISGYQYDRLMRFVRDRFPRAQWSGASLGLMGEGEHSSDWYADGLEKLIRLTRWQDPAAQPWNSHGMRQVGVVTRSVEASMRRAKPKEREPAS